MTDFMTAWARFYPDCIPISHLLKYAEPDRWLRFHYVPERSAGLSRADSVAAALHVMKTAASAVLGDGADCWVSGELYPPDDLAAAAQGAVIRQLGMTWAGRVDVPGDERDADIHAARTQWAPDGFEDILRRIDNDEVRLMWMHAATGAVFAPYDRGVDLILPDTAEVGRLACAHSDWLSSVPGGW